MILKPDRQYTFSEIFKLDADIDDLLNELGYTYRTQKLDLVPYPIPSEVAQDLQEEFYRYWPKISFKSEIARREFIISDILKALLDHVEFRIEPQYKITSERLRGSVDYLLRGERQCVVIEAKNDEMERGFRQLAVELIAASEHLKQDRLYGAVTTGRMWTFGFLDRNECTITQDIDIFTAPVGVGDLMNTLAGLIVSDRLKTGVS